MTMTIDQRQTRALLRSFELNGEAQVRRAGADTFTVASATADGVRYLVRAEHAGDVRCSCKAAEYGRPCWHAEAVRTVMIRETAAQQAAGRGVVA